MSRVVIAEIFAKHAPFGNDVKKEKFHLWTYDLTHLGYRLNF